MLPTPQIDDCVRLAVDIPNLYLQRGDMGRVCSTWFTPTTAYEVTFRPRGLAEEVRVLVLAEQVHVEEVPRFAQ